MGPPSYMRSVVDGNVVCGAYLYIYYGYFVIAPFDPDPLSMNGRFSDSHFSLDVTRIRSAVM